MQIKSSKIFIRFLMFYVLITLGFLFGSTLTGSIEKLQMQHDMPGVISRIFFITSPFSVFLLWGLMFYHWGTHNFTSKKYKTMWFLFMSLGMFVGSWIYYFVVYEFKKTVIQE